MTTGTYDGAAEIWNRTNDYDAVLRYIREIGLSKLDAIKAVREFCGVSLGEAKKIANASTVWADTLEASNELHDAFLNATTDETAGQGT